MKKLTNVFVSGFWEHMWKEFSAWLHDALGVAAVDDWAESLYRPRLPGQLPSANQKDSLSERSIFLVFPKFKLFGSAKYLGLNCNSL